MAKKDRKYKIAISKAISWVAGNFDKVDIVFDLLKILNTKSPDEVVQYNLSMEYTTEAGKTYKLNLPKSKVKDSSEIQNTIASIIVAAIDDIEGITVEEVKKKTISRKDTMDKAEENKESK